MSVSRIWLMISDGMISDRFINDGIDSVDSVPEDASADILEFLGGSDLLQDHFDMGY